MFETGDIHDVVIKSLKKFHDDRGWLIELFRHDDLEEEFYPVMAYISQTKSGIARGPHEHVDQADYFCFLDPSNFKIYLWDARKDSPTYNKKMTIVGGEQNPISMIVPKGVVHAYKNVGKIDGIVFCIKFIISSKMTPSFFRSIAGRTKPTLVTCHYYSFE